MRARPGWRAADGRRAGALRAAGGSIRSRLRSLHTAEDRVVGAAAAQRAVGELGGQRGVPARQPALGSTEGSSRFAYASRCSHRATARRRPPAGPGRSARPGRPAGRGARPPRRAAAGPRAADRRRRQRAALSAALAAAAPRLPGRGGRAPCSPKPPAQASTRPGPGAARGPIRRRPSAACPAAARRPARPGWWPCRPAPAPAAAHSSPGASGPATSAGASAVVAARGAVRRWPHRPELDPGLAEHGPRARARACRRGSAGPPRRGLVPAHPGILRRDLGREAYSLGWLGPRLQLPGLDPVQRRDQQAGAGLGEPGQQVAGGVLRADRLGHHAVHRPGVQLRTIRNVVAPVMSSPCTMACCTGAAPRHAGSSEKCRFTQPCAGDVQRGPRDQRAVRGDRAAVRRDGPQPAEEFLVAGPGRLEHLQAGLGRALGDRAGHLVQAAACRGVRPGDHGRHLVPGPSSASSAGTAACGVPANTRRMRPP